MSPRITARFWSYIDPILTIFQLVLGGLPIVFAALMRSPGYITRPYDLWNLLFAPGVTKILVRHLRLLHPYSADVLGRRTLM